jgi:NCAIR mutase (PurE)-related protein
VCDVVIVVAGADAALPTAVAGFVDAPVLAVPTCGPWSPPRGSAPVAVAASASDAAVMAARMLRTAAHRALHIAQSAAATAAAAGHVRVEAAAHAL